ncbi:gliding motility-associated C-terminal domain-containing protein [Chryseolinea lacunae]|uniref:Gliding motility-associated C-terminal domain-containing protein n=1 Tax=Chryseolinea lacunae TaxID=2801331 RepID=A0ABS1L1A3_9BACT|nr:gliding motility-associated C-terminal domain-containing protein [Chryseolinea lacunae]MBL0745480.1 gliding motility-associated C-terminal domain-containing protein [Chryseolinea lacunae]
MKRYVYLFAVCLSMCFCATASFAQVGTEICANGIDDDGDGFIDCFDKDCANKTVCTGGYVGNDLLCEVKPSQFPAFTLALESASPDGTANHLGRAVIGDIDGDGTPEMMTVNKYSKKLFILEGKATVTPPATVGVNKIKLQKTVTFTPAYEDIAIANLDNGNGKCGEIFILGTDWSLYAFDCTLTQLWVTKLPGDPGTIGIADFNGDGKEEIYARNAIFNAQTGATIVAPTASWSNFNGGPVAVDVLVDGTATAHKPTDVVKDDNLELVAGGVVFSVNIGAGTITSQMTIANYGKRVDIDATSVADIDLDGSLDVVASGKNTTDGNTTIFYWNLVTGNVKTYADPMAGNVTIQACPPSTKAYYANGWHQGTGRVNIADLDGDGKPNLAYVSGKYLYALKDDPANATKLVPLWPKVTVFEETSGNTGCTLFDFNGDGKSEIVYRDEKFIYIIDGTDGSVFTQQPCVSRTNREFPIVADVDADGSTELCVTCRTVDFVLNGTITDPTDPNYGAADRTNFCDINQAEFSQVRVYRSGAEPWVPARRVWNQHGYFNVNVNDNLTIPRIQQKHHLAFSENVCTVGKNRPLNSFLNQSPFLNSLGCPKYASPDLAFVDNSLVVNQPTCPSLNFTVSFKIKNKGDNGLSGDVPISFYDNDPTKVGAKKLNTTKVKLTNLAVGTEQTITNITVNGPGSNFTLYIVLNDGGTTVPTPIKLPNTNFIECDYGNNIISSPVTPLPVKLTAQKVQDNIVCSGSGTPDNGSAKAFINVSGVPNSTDYNFYWSAGTVVKPTPDFVGAVITGRPKGTYTVFAVHKTAKCSSDTVKVDIGEVQSNFSIRIDLVNGLTNCVDTPNGELTAVVLDGSGNVVTGANLNKYSFAWYQGTDVLTDPKIGNTQNKAGLVAITYSALVIEKATGCQRFDSYNLPDNTVAPNLTVTKEDVLCSNTTSGKASALVDGVTAGYKFEWYRGSSVKAVADFTGDTFNNLAQGDYTVVATKTSTKCKSAPKKITIIKTVPPDITVTKSADQISCDASAPTGAASVTVVGNPADFTFQWYVGQNTVNAIAGATQSTVDQLDGNSYYTVKVKSKITGCEATEEVHIDDKVIPLSLITIDLTANSTCAPRNGTIEVKAVSLDGPSDYEFLWFNGTSEKASSDYPANKTNILSGIPDGDYTVKAVHKVRKCATPAKTVKILNGIVPFTIDLTSSTPPTDCNLTEGILNIGVSNANINGYDFSWFTGGAAPGTALPATAAVSSTSSTSSLTKLAQGTYGVTVTNRDTGCPQSTSFFLKALNSHQLDFVSKQDITNCVPGKGGEIVVELTNLEPGFTNTAYSVYLFPGTTDPGTSSGTLLPNVGATDQYATLAPLDPGDYTLVAISNAAITVGCRAQQTVTVKQVTTDPVIDGDPTASIITTNTFCKTSATNVGNGSIFVDVAGTPTDFDYAWSNGQTTQTASNLVPGDYKVRVTYNTLVNQGCFVDRFFTVPNKPMDLSVNMANGDLQTADVLNCDPVTGKSAAVIGSVFFQNIQVDNSPIAAPFTGYNFDFRREDTTPVADADGNGQGWDRLSMLAVGNYYVVATDVASSCDITASFAILDKTPNTVDMDLLAFRNDVHCVAPMPGFLEIAPKGNSTTGYAIEWYSASAAPGDPALATTAHFDFSAVTFTTSSFKVVVKNNSNDCVADQIYAVPPRKNQILIDASSTPLTFCVNEDGTALASILFGGLDDAGVPNAINQNAFNFVWSTGQTTREIKPLGAANLGTVLKVYAIDPSDAITDPVTNLPLCVSDTVDVILLDQRVYPPVTAEALMPVTNCDPTIPNGVATASVNGDFINYDFTWYEGLPPVAALPVFYSGVQADGLKPNMAPDNTVYTVQATDKITGCSNTTTIQINYSPVAIPMPQIEILSQVTSCDTDHPNGSLSISVDQNISDYVFDWYIGQVEKATADFVGNQYDSLAIGFYSATATSIITGCKSPLVSEELIFVPVYPEFDFEIKETHCTAAVDSNSPTPDGSLALFITNSVEIGKIEWFQGNTLIQTGPIASNIDRGDYEVEVTSLLGCPTTKTVSVKTDIRPFNGVSRNGDGSNDIFNIGCIEAFDQNNVKIFNRAGTLVYEAEGYDNNGVFFDGKSNKGISLMGNNLPGGTYYYIIDKRDGSKPVAGYLELVN